MRLNKYILFLILITISNLTNAQEKDKFSFKVKGLIFGDLYHVQKHHQTDAVGATGAVMRRIYLTFDTKYGNWYSRLRFEGNQSGEYETYEFEAEFKDLFIGYKFDKHKIIVGLSPTKTFDIVEKLWGLRYLVRTPMDLQGNPSRDLGIAADGYIYEDWGLKYRVMYGDGAEFGAESGDGVKFQGGITWQPNKYWTFDFYSDHEVMEGNRNRKTIQFFAAYTAEKFRWGALYAHQDRQEDPTLELFSIYAVGQVYKNFSVIGRVDRIMEPSPRGDNIAYIPFDPTSKATFVIGGLEFPVGKYFTFTPNIIFIDYDKNNQGIEPDPDLSYRLTIFFKIK
jgi:hypothetical protein